MLLYLDALSLPVLCIENGFWFSTRNGSRTLSTEHNKKKTTQWKHRQVSNDSGNSKQVWCSADVAWLCVVFAGVRVCVVSSVTLVLVL